MAALTPSQALVGRMSVSATATTTAGPDSISNAALLAVCERGPLYNFLNTTFGSQAAIVAAFAAKGGILNVSSSAAPPDAAWSLDGGKPALTLTNTTNAAACSIRIALSYTATR